MLYKLFRAILVAIAVFICLLFQEQLQAFAQWLYNLIVQSDAPEWMLTEAAKEYIPKAILCFIEAIVICILASPFRKKGD